MSKFYQQLKDSKELPPIDFNKYLRGLYNKFLLSPNFHNLTLLIVMLREYRARCEGDTNV